LESCQIAGMGAVNFSSFVVFSLVPAPIKAILRIAQHDQQKLSCSRDADISVGCV
jgi:hypothetical protein